MLALVRAPHPAVVSALQADGVGIVGPTAASGWTAVWLPDAERVLPLGDVVSIEEDDDGDLTLGVHASGRSHVWTWSCDPEDRSPSEVQDASRSLCEVFGRPERERELADLLQDVPGAEDVASSLDLVLGLPALDEPAHERAVALTRADRTAAHVAARVLAGEIGRTGFVTLEHGWSAIRPLDAADAHEMVTPTLAAGADGRHRAALSLWRGPGGTSGFLIALGPDEVSAVAWNTDWRDLGTEGWEHRDAVATTLAEHVGTGDVDVAELRALVRARTWNGDPLAHLAFLLGLPRTALAILDDHDNAPALELVEPASMWRVVWDAAKETNREPRITARWLQLTIAVAAILIGLVGLAAAATGYAVIATDGAFVDQDGVDARDWAFTVMFTVAGPLNLWCAVQLIRRGTFF